MKHSLLIAFFVAYCTYLTTQEKVSKTQTDHFTTSQTFRNSEEPVPVNALPLAKKLTFAKDIAPLVFKNCTPCHRPGQVAPFSYLGYEDFKRHSREILELTAKHEMPPWKAKHGYGNFQGERRLSDQQIKLIADWVKQGMLPGDEKDMPPVPDYVDSWQLGTPDLVIGMPESLTIPGNDPDFFMSFVIPVNLPEDKYITAMDILPSNRRVVHHTTLLMDPSGKARVEEEKVMKGQMRVVENPSANETMIGGWAPGTQARRFPNGLARKLPKNSDLILETHFHPTGKTETERTEIGLYFADKPQPKEPYDMILSNVNIDIPANTIKHVKIDRVLDNDINVYGIAAHAHFICKEVIVHAILPDKKDMPLLWIPDWDFNWQEQYRYEKPFILPKGTRILVDFTFDNTSENFRNPNSPPIHVKYGGESRNEMANIMLNTEPM